MPTPLLYLSGSGSLGYRDRAGRGTSVGSGAVRYQPAPGARVNLVRGGGSFEDAGSYNPFGTQTTHQRSTERAHSGQYSLKATVTVEGATTSMTPSNGRRSVLFNPGASHVYSIWCFNPQPTPRSVKLAVTVSRNDASGQFILNGPEETLPPGVWTRLWMALVPTAQVVGAQYAYGNVRMANTYTYPCGVGDSLYLDDEQLEEGVTPTPWLDPEKAVWLNLQTGQLGTPYNAQVVERAVFWVEEGTTNLAINPSAEVDATTGTTARAAATITRDTAYAAIGSASFKVVTPNAAAGEGVNLRTATALNLTGSANPYTGQVRVRGSGTVNVFLQAAYTDSTFETGAATLVTLTDAWQPVAPSSVTLNPGKTVNLIQVIVHTNVQQGITFWCDAVQIEQRAYATSCAIGDMGNGYSWAGTAHASASTRAAAKVTVPQAGHIAGDQGAVVLRFQRLLSGDLGNYPVLWAVGATSVGYGSGFLDATAGKLATAWRPPLASAIDAGAAPAVNVADVAYFDWQGTAMRAGRLTGSLASGVRPAASPVIAGNPLSVGGQNTAEQQLNGYVWDVLVFDRPLTAAERQTLNSAAVWGWDVLPDLRPQRMGLGIGLGIGG